MSSTQIAQWMAKGWVLTDQPCPSRGCGIPLLRSTDGTVRFCVDCDKSPPTAASASAQSSTTSISDHPSRPSTPATSMSSTLSSPVFASPAETEESLRRRQQSDRASAEMAKLLLKGWAMLADECPSASCPRIPLMRPPKAEVQQCVCCANWYIDERDANGFERLVPVNPTGSSQMANSPMTITPQASSSSTKGKGVDREGAPSIGPTPVPTVGAPSPEQRKPSTLPPPDRSATLKLSATEQSPTNVQATVQALDATLGHLASRLTALTSQPVFDPSAVTVTSQAITAAAQALTELSKLQRAN
ncbi:hypothetical protein PENSPDRAFT_681124 [Peniophora sp. CONT]|nr:hypothetical protein PENSPDRAFT_681124 [Peniophora sp. CONT]